jgi:hypothetical protein
MAIAFKSLLPQETIPNNIRRYISALALVSYTAVSGHLLWGGRIR